jgi:hypothetical protein
MHKIILYTGFGWLTFRGLLHFIIDVVSQYAQEKRAPGPETTLFYGMKLPSSLESCGTNSRSMTGPPSGRSSRISHLAIRGT